MFLGIDISTYFEEKEINAKYYIDGREVDPIKIFVNQGVSYMRIRVWNHPYDEEGHPYLAGTNDTKEFIRLGTLAKKYGMRIILDFHYSDFWADPGKQYAPKEWKDLSFEEVVDKVYEFSKEVLLLAKEKDLPIDYVQVGNEITNGMIWPFGQLDGSVSPRRGYENLFKLLESGVKAVRDFSQAKVIIHLERSYDQVIYNEFFSHMVKYGLDYDVIGMSYYPYWHGTTVQLFANIKMLKEKFHKDVMIVETGYGFTAEDYIKEGSHAQLVFTDGEKDYLNQKMEYPMTKDGQRKFVKDLLEKAQTAGVVGVCYWEPLWLPGEGICWASKYVLPYIHQEDAKSLRNEWANQCLYDYEGNALPALSEFRIK